MVEQKLKRYYELKGELKEYHKRPVGDRIKQGGLLEQKIKEKFNKETADKILTRSEDFSKDNFDKWEKIRKEYMALRDELEELGILTYDEEGNEQIVERVK